MTVAHCRWLLVSAVLIGLLIPAHGFAQLTIATSSLPAGQIGFSYSASLSATGGTPPYTWSINSGILPQSLALNPSGIINGTVTGGAQSFTLRVTDATDASTTKGFTIDVCDAAKDTASDNQTFEDQGGMRSVGYTASAVCGPVTPASNVPWIAIASGSGNGSINFSVTPNNTSLARSGSIIASFNSAPAAPIVFTYTITQYAKLIFVTPASLPAGIVGQSYSVSFQATGGSNINRSFLNFTEILPPGFSFSGQVLNGIPTQVGNYVVAIAVQDQDPFTQAFFQTVQNFNLVVNPPLVLQTTSLADATIGTLYFAGLQATGGVPPYRWSVASGKLPAGLSLNATTGAISGIPAPDTDDIYSITFQVSDASSGVANALIKLKVNPVPLVIQNTALAPATEGAPYQATLTATGGVSPYSWVAISLPSWLALTSGGQLSGTPPTGSAGTYNISINVQDNGGQFASATLKLVVNSAPLAIVTTSPLTDAKEGVSFSASFQARGGKTPYTWSASGLPSFLSLSAGGVLTGTPPSGSAGSYNFNVRVNDASGVPASAPFSLKVTPLIAITNSSLLPQAVEGQAYSVTFNATGGAGSYKWSANGLPSWATLATNGSLSGTPLRGSAGGYLLNVTVTDGSGNTRTAPFILPVVAAAGGLTVITPSPLPNATANSYYAATLTATGGTPPYKWSGSAPDGLTIGSNGLLSGAPSNDGKTTVTAQVTDAKGNVAFGALGLEIAAAKLTIAISSPLAVGELTVPYSVSFASSGGSRPLVWSVASGSLPPGLTLDSNGVLSGTPTATGDFNFSVRVDSALNTPNVGTAAQWFDANAVSESSPFEILIRPFAPDLVLSAATLTFSAIRGGAAPPIQTVAVISSTKDPVVFSATSDAPWLNASASGTTPGRIDIGIDQTSLTAGTYIGIITVTAPNRGPRTVKVTLTVAEAPPVLQVAPASLQFFSDGTLQTSSQAIFVRNTGQGNLDFTVSSDAAWLSVSAGTALGANAGATLVVTANLLGLAAGSYLATIEIDSAAGDVKVPVSLLVSTRPKLILSSTGILLQARQGNGVSGPAPATFLVSSSSGTVHFTVEKIGIADWLTLTSNTGTATAASPATVAFQVNSIPLAKGVYYALLRVSAPEPFNSPQDFVVVLNVVGATTGPVPDPSPTGLLFSAAASATPPSQTVTVYTSSDQAAAYQTSVNTQSGGAWLSATPSTGSISTAQPAQLAVSVNATNLAPGVYTGGVNVSIGNPAVVTMNVTLIVPAVNKPSESGAIREDATSNCSPASLVVSQSALPGNFSTPAGWPRSVAVQLADDCGNLVPNGRVLAEFSNGDPPLTLALSDSKSSVYSATWTPARAVSQLVVTARASATGLKDASAQVVGGVTDSAAPILAKNGTVHNLYPQTGAPLAPGTIVAIFGSALAASTNVSDVPLPTDVNGTSVVIGGRLAPIYFSSSGQINAQLPVNLVPGQEYQVLVLANRAYTTPDTIRIAPVTPGVARFANGQVIAQHLDFSLVTQDSPAKPAEFLVVYLAGMGLTDQAVDTGAPAPTEPLANVSSTPIVTLDGERVPLLFAGLTPGFVGLYQINFQVPGDAKAGNLKLEISQAGASANLSVLPVVR